MAVVAQFRSIGPVYYYSVRPGRVVEVDRIDPAKATTVLRSMGYSEQVARLGVQLGLITRKEMIAPEVVIAR